MSNYNLNYVIGRHICYRKTRLLRVPWTARRSNKSILKEITLGFLGKNDAKAETPVLWPPHAKS